ncbi:hypothetical protein V9T40_009578 [Parthenolecanium corni]|uniref:Ceramide transfer protein n=1 Tax=Parthenolecanium corni TaxID=536013 RepID=A0AAN9TNS0_9HEMI
MSSNGSDEEDAVAKCNFPKLQGYVSKWTNPLYGWQKRWLVLKDGTLTYFKTEHETGYGCRGAISLYKAVLKAHELDSCCFNVTVNDCTWYLRANSPEEREHWIKALIASKQDVDSGYNSQNNLIRHESSTSLQSNSLSNHSSNSSLTFHKSQAELKSKITDIETLRELLCKQVNNLQEQFIQHVNVDVGEKESVVNDFKVDVMTCKATAQSISEILFSCVELISLQEDTFAKCLEQETNKRLVLEDKYRQRMVQLEDTNKTENEIRPIHEDEFYDAEESEKENMENRAAPVDENENKTVKPPCKLEHHLSAEIERVVTEQVQYARMGIGKDSWQLFSEEGEMKMYRREEEVNGLVIDPLKACHYVKGFSAHEMCYYFFQPEYRYEWEITLDTNGMTVIEKLSEDTLIFHQMHKRMWPAAQRDAVFWSHMREVPLDKSDDKNVLNCWVVVNNSTDIDSLPANGNGKVVRIYMTVCLMCQTVVLDPKKDKSQLTRADIACKITYCSVVNPGGWAPSAALRMIYKREYPRFLRKFTAYVTSKTKGKSIMF